MRYLRKLSSFLLVLVMILGITMAVSADETGYSITLTGADADHSYEAYQVLTGTMSKGKLVEVSWGEGVDGSALLQDLQELEGTTFDACASAADVAKILSEQEDDSALLQTFAECVSQNLVAEKAVKSTDITAANATSSTYKIELPAVGYYFVKDGSDFEATNGHSYSNYVLKVADNTAVTVKSTCSELAKYIVDGSDKVTANGKHGVGDLESYRIETTVPNTKYYANYHLVVQDTLSKGLEIQADTVKIKLGTSTLVKGTDYTVRAEKDATTGITTVAFDFGDIATNVRFNRVGQPLVITYQAKIGQDANIGNAGNTNTAYLEYSSDPRHAERMGQTPKSVVSSYVTGIRLYQYTMDGTDRKALAGAQFQISGTSLVQVQTGVESYTLDPDGIYWKLKDGTYTKRAWTEDTKNLYDSLTDKYTKDLTQQWVSGKSRSLAVVGTTDENGLVTFYGLGEGTYEITAVRAAAGYTMLKQPIRVTVSFYPETVYAADGTTVLYTKGWHYAVEYADGTPLEVAEDQVDANGILTLNVMSGQDLKLPSTGGMGTTGFYVLGGILVAAALVLLVIRKRMKEKS